MAEVDIYQQRYLKHQERKRNSLTGKSTKKHNKYSRADRCVLERILKNRESQRIFKDGEIDIKPILKAIQTAPSSCNRKAVSVRVIDSREDKELLSGLLVGGVGWSYRADKILLLVADSKAYKSAAEKDIMPYIDAGVIIQTAYLSAEVNDIGVCYVNPNIRDINKEIFRDRFLNKEEMFCGALILGNY